MLDALINVAEVRGYRVRWHRGGSEAAWFPDRCAARLLTSAVEYVAAKAPYIPQLHS